MAISLERANQHVSEWAKKLEPFGSRAWWPRYLYHSCDITVAERILRTSCVLSRNQAMHCGGLICDVANQGAVWNNPDAHEYVRLYFRPKNAFHLETEGIKSLSDPYRQNPHMSIPVVFLFDFVEVMTLANSFFLPENFAISGSRPNFGDESFDTLDFLSIYHDSPTNQLNQERIKRCRMAEVVTKGALSLSHCKIILVRNQFDQRSLEFLVNNLSDTSRVPRIYADVRGGAFFGRGIKIQGASLRDRKLLFSFTPPFKNPQPTYRISIQHGNYSGRFDLAAGRWSVTTGHDEVDPVRIEIEDCLAFHGYLPSGTSEVV